MTLTLHPLARTTALLAPALLAGTVHAQSSTVVGFDGGTSGSFAGNALFEASGGNPGGNAHHLGLLFFPELRTGAIGEPVNAAFVGDYSGFADVTFRIDVKVDSLTDFIGNEIVRSYGIKLIDRDVMGPSGPSGVYFDLALISAAGQPNWTTLSVTITDPTSTTLPAGWIGFGDDDPVTFAPILPPGATFASVLAGVDEVHFTGATPGFFFADANFDMRVDNVEVEVNSAGLGTRYCAAVVNSTGSTGHLAAAGSAVAAANSLRLDATQLPQNAFGFFLTSRTQAAVNQPGGSQGVLCVGGNIGRYVGAGQIQDSGAGGAFALSLDLTQHPTPTGFVTVSAGETWNFQAWHRDSLGGVATSNFTDALEILFL